MKKFLIDMVHFWHHRGGVTHVWDCVLKEWVKSGFASQVILIDRGELPEVAKNYQVVKFPYFHNSYQDESEALQALCDELGADGFMSSGDTRPLTTPTVQLVHDFIVEDQTYPHYPPDIFRKHASMNAAQRIIAVSQATARRIPAFLTDSLKPLTVAANASDVSREENIDELPSVLASQYFLHVGGLYGYKNAEAFLEAVKDIPDEERDFGLVFTSDASELLSEHGLQTMDIHCGAFERPAMARVYGKALALVHTSRTEGFGLPLIEALACGCPVICYDNEVNREIAGTAAHYILPGENEKEQIQSALVAMKNPAYRQQLRAAGMVRAAFFSWQETAETYAEELQLL